MSTTAPWIGFIDDDRLLRDALVRNGIHFALEHPRQAGFGGRVILDWEQPPRGTSKRHGWCFAEHRITARRADRTGPRGAGLLVLRRTAIEESGWVDEPRRRIEWDTSWEATLRCRFAWLGASTAPADGCVPSLRHRIPSGARPSRDVAAITRALGASQAYADALRLGGFGRVLGR